MGTYDTHIGMSTVQTVIALWPTLRSFGDDIGVTYNTAKQMKRRGSIPVRYWPSLIAAAGERGVPLTYDQLVAIHSANTNSEVAA